MGLLYPFYLEDCIPGDRFKIDFAAQVKFNPFVGSLMHNIKVVYYYFFVPYRLLQSDFDKFITGGPDGNYTSSIPNYTGTTAQGSLWDYFGFPVGYDVTNTNAVKVNLYPWSAYRMIYNYYFRDQNLQQEISETEVVEFPLRRNWNKDYFTSALPWRQRGPTIAVPINTMFTLGFNMPTGITFDTQFPTRYAFGVGDTGLFYAHTPFGDENFNRITTEKIYKTIAENLVASQIVSSLSLHELRQIMAIQ